MSLHRWQEPTSTDRALEVYGRTLAALLEAARLTDRDNRRRRAQDRLGAIEHRFMLTPAVLITHAMLAVLSVRFTAQPQRASGLPDTRTSAANRVPPGRFGSV